jgi:dipeptidyl aminopeptidase/acylaminoacyl peptidase
MSKRRVEPADILRLRIITGLQLSPLGDKVLYTLKSADVEGNRYLSHLWMLDLAAGEVREFTGGPVFDSGARFSPDGRWIAFARKVDDSTQIRVVRADGGESSPVTRLPPGSAGDIAWAPDSERIAFTHRREPRFKGGKEKTPVFRRIARLSYKEEGKGFKDGEYTHVWVASRRGGGERQITSGDQDDVNPAWSPDGGLIAFCSNRQPDADRRAGYVDLWTVAPEGGAPARLERPHGPCAAPRWSPDGRRIAWLGHEHPDESWGVRNTHVWAASAAGGGDARDLVAGFDRPCTNATITDTRPAHAETQPPVWSPDGAWIYLIASDRGSVRLCRVASAGGGTPQPITRGAHEVTAFDLHPSGRRAVAAIGTPLNPCDLHEVDLESGETRRLTSINDDVLSGLELSAPEPFECASRDGGPVHGWILRPPGVEAGAKVPLLLEVHGGPHGQYGEAFFHEFQLLAGRGYAIVYTNPRGSQGYGEEHARAIVGDWGNLDYADLMAAVDHVVKMGFVDERRLGVLGGSYGGYMTNWIVGQTDRFRAAITMRCLSNAVSFFGTSDFGHELDDELKGNPWDSMEKLWKQSPLAHVKNVKTPLLIIHSEGDLRCPVEQAEQMYAALKALGREVEFLRFPEENHDLSRAGRPDRRVARLEAIVEWFDRKLGTVKPGLTVRGQGGSASLSHKVDQGG